MLSVQEVVCWIGFKILFSSCFQTFVWLELYKGLLLLAFVNQTSVQQQGRECSKIQTPAAVLPCNLDLRYIAWLASTEQSVHVAAANAKQAVK